ncbi:DUF397 domain-containing protein [Actinomadura sp. KC06]|uniref:DUF397 domain-containing protein n=1 Tax=Actinomadura sp. KC06 TaxID=2530369 RepID=UPI00104EE9F6|nr:DUF397 domain-containing protein [Actinomadura sp. KC06]TDD21872.1 DUF397 domain-containing protein [Actinomadura sp. KC06]
METGWRKSSHSGAINDEACIEVAGLIGGIGIRDSKDPDGARLILTGDRFGWLLRWIKVSSSDRFRPCR